MSLIVDIQRACEEAEDPLPSDAEIQHWLEGVFFDQQKPIELTVRIVGDLECAHLNKTYRQKSGATNVLSFPSEIAEDVDISLLGDIVVCAPVVAKEAKIQQKPLAAHWAHMIIHGSLHLLGYDHIETEQAKIMEDKEISLLEKLGYPNPYN